MSKEQEPADQSDVSSPNTADVAPTTADIVEAAQTVHRYLPETPLVRSEFLSAELEADVYLKREDVLPTGAFKVRGGVNFVHNNGSRYASRGLVTASTGNHGQSLAYAGREFDIPVTIVVPNDANPGKVDAIESFGATVVQHGESMAATCQHATELASSQGSRFVHPANEPDLVAGVGTAGLEAVEQCPGIDYVFCPVGGGSSAAGYCLTVGSLPDSKVIGVQVSGADAVYRAWHDGDMTSLETIDTFAEGLAVGTPYEFTLSVLRDGLADIVRVEDDDLTATIYQLLSEEGLLLEGAAAAGIAGAFAERDQLADSTVVIPVSGRNLAVSTLRRVLAEHP